MNTGRYRFRFYLNARHKISFHNVDSKIHPHTWELILHVKKCGEGFVRFSDIENQIRQLLCIYEGSCLNEKAPFDSVMPTMENIGDELAVSIANKLTESCWELLMLEIGENPARTYIVTPGEGEGYGEWNGSGVRDSCGEGYSSGEGDGSAQNKQCSEIGSALGLVSAASDPYKKSAEIGSALGLVSVVSDPIESDSDPEPVHHEHDAGLSAGAEKNRAEKEDIYPRRVRKRKVEKRPHWLVLLLGIVLLAAEGLAVYFWITRDGFYPWGSDSWYHLFKGHLLYKSIGRGNFFPLYSDIWYNGIQPLRYWAPLPHYVLALIEFITQGNTALSYNLFIILMLLTGGGGWLLWGARTRRYMLSVILALLWFILPDNLRVMFSEGNLSRVTVTVIFPYLLLAAEIYLCSDNGVSVNERFSRKRSEGLGKASAERSPVAGASNNACEYRYANLIAVAVLMLMITLCHAMIAAMVAVTITIFALFYGIAEKKLIRSVHIIASAACGIAAAGIWLVPALTGGLLSMDPEAVKELAEGLTYPALDTLNPMLRLSDPNVFYFGTSIFAAALLGIFFGSGKARAAFAVTITIFAGTTKALLPIILKLPLSQAFWMMRFTPLAMALFFAGLLYWKSLNRKVLSLIIVLVLADSAVSFGLLAHDGQMPSASLKILDPAAKLTDNRLAMLDDSRMGSFPSYFLSFNDSGVTTRQVYGSGWQGAATAPNIMMLNTALQLGWYDYLLDRCLEHGADTVIITEEMTDDVEALTTAAEKAGYKQANDFLPEEGGPTGALTFKYPIEGSFGTTVKYQGIGIGRYASGLSLIFPQLESGRSAYIDDYTLEELAAYKTVYLSGFSFRSRQAAEDIVLRLSEKGVRVVVDLTNADEELFSSRAAFLGVLAEAAVFEGSLPDISTEAGNLKFESAIPAEYSKWRAIYLENLDNVYAGTYFEEQQLDVIGTKYNDNIVFIGLNLPYYTMLTGDPAAEKLLEEATGLRAGALPEREPVRLEVTTEDNRISLRAEEAGVVTGIAALDTFEATGGDYSVIHNMVRMETTELTLTAGYPELGKGIAVTCLGLIAFVILILFTRRRNGGRRVCLRSTHAEKETAVTD